jgi:hypothetical protein
MNSSAPDPDRFNAELCEAYRVGVQRGLAENQRQIDKVDSRLNALIMFMLVTVAGIVIYVGQAMFTQVFVTSSPSQAPTHEQPITVPKPQRP